MDRLNDKEREVAALVAEGASNKEIARALRMAEQTVKWHLMTTYRLLELDPGRNMRVALALLVARDQEGGGA